MSERASLAKSNYVASRTTLLQRRQVRNWIATICLALSDAAAFAVAALLFRGVDSLPQVTLKLDAFLINQPIDLFYILGAIFVVARYISGDYRRRLPFWDGARVTTVSVLIVAFPLALLTIFGNVKYSIFAQVASWALVIVAVPVFRQAVRFLLQKGSLWWLPSALIVEELDVSDVIRAFRGSLSLGFDIRFHVARGEQSVNVRELPDVASIRLRDPSHIVVRLVEAGCTEILVATEHQQDAMIEELVQHALSAGMGVAFIPPVRHRSLLGLTINYFFDRDFMPMPAHSSLSWWLKRFMDIVGSIVLLTLLSPLLLVITLLIRRDSGGSFFVQRRVGLNGEEFPCIKFRTMDVDAEQQLEQWKRYNAPPYREYLASNFKLLNDPRTTRTGQWLRRTSLDELPQLINVLAGHMSLVGPRPLIAREVSDYGVTFKLYRQLRPGMTGLWQISGRSRTTFADRVSLDYCYIRNWSLFFDIVILLKTIGVLFSKDGAY